MPGLASGVGPPGIAGGGGAGGVGEMVIPTFLFYVSLSHLCNDFLDIHFNNRPTFFETSNLLKIKSLAR